ncbi:uncharacterized protein C6orf118 homolog [Pelobates fuscus]|uniref:uncharacterized protein C6orf118 homolog n=1 Tax=Pelobates fuscus TaxID=191477 RepID=UPI002FE447A4
MLENKQQKRMIKLDKLLDGIERANKHDTEAYTSGHLNHNHLFKPQVLEKKVFWKNTKKSDHLHLSELQCGHNNKFMKMRVAPTNFTLKTKVVQDQNVESKSLFSPRIQLSGSVTLTKTPIASGFTSNQEYNVPLQSEGIDLPDLKQLKSENCINRTSFQDFNHEYNFVPAFFAGVTKADQFSIFQTLEKDILEKEDLTKDFFKHASAEKYKTELEKDLMKVAHIKPPHFARLQIFSETFGNLCRDSSIFGNILSEIKNAYDLYIEHLLDTQSSTQFEVLMSDINGLRKRAVKTEDVQETFLSVQKLEYKAQTVLECNEQLRHFLKKTLQTSSTKETEKCEEPPIDITSKMSRNEYYFTKDMQLLPSKRREVLALCKEVQYLEEKIYKNMSHAVNSETTAQYIKDIQAETVKLQSSNDFLHRANKDLHNEIKKIVLKQKLALEAQTEIKELMECFISSDK